MLGPTKKLQAFASVPSGTEVVERLYPEDFFAGPADLIEGRIKTSDQAGWRGNTLKVTCADSEIPSRDDLKSQIAYTKGAYIQRKVGISYIVTKNYSVKRIRHAHKKHGNIRRNRKRLSKSISV